MTASKNTPTKKNAGRAPHSSTTIALSILFTALCVVFAVAAFYKYS